MLTLPKTAYISHFSICIYLLKENFNFYSSPESLFVTIPSKNVLTVGQEQQILVAKLRYLTLTKLIILSQ